MRPEQTDGERSYLSGCGGLKSKLRVSNGIYRAAGEQHRDYDLLSYHAVYLRFTFPRGESGGGGRSGSLNGEKG